MTGPLQPGANLPHSQQQQQQHQHQYVEQMAFTHPHAHAVSHPGHDSLRGTESAYDARRGLQEQSAFVPDAPGMSGTDLDPDSVVLISMGVDRSGGVGGVRGAEDEDARRRRQEQYVFVPDAPSTGRTDLNPDSVVLISMGVDRSGGVGGMRGAEDEDARRGWQEQYVFVPDAPSTGGTDLDPDSVGCQFAVDCKRI